MSQMHRAAIVTYALGLAIYTYQSEPDTKLNWTKNGDMVNKLFSDE